MFRVQCQQSLASQGVTGKTVKTDAAGKSILPDNTHPLGMAESISVQAQYNLIAMAK